MPNTSTRYSGFLKLVGLICAIAVHGASAQTVRMHGGVGMVKALTAQQTAIELKAGTKLELIGNGTGRGLTDLAAGLADVALVAGSLNETAAVINKAKPGSIDVSGMKETLLTTVKNAFITHPSAGIKTITEAQLRDLLSGKVNNWSQVGGANLPIKVVLPAEGDGTRTTFQSAVLKGADFTKDAIVRNSAKDLTVVVMQLPGACSIVSAINVDGNVTQVALEKDVPMPWLLVTKGDPTGDVRKAIDAAKELVK